MQHYFSSLFYRSPRRAHGQAWLCLQVGLSWFLFLIVIGLLWANEII